VAAKIFISYRRDDSAGAAGRLHDRLERDLGRDLLFMDVDAIPLGQNFVKILGDAVAQCDVFLAVIGKNWIDARDEMGRRRLDDPNDFVRIEIATALKRGIPVVPILLDGAQMPGATQLPEDMKELPLRNGLSVRHESFHADIEKLVRSIKGERKVQNFGEAPSTTGSVKSTSSSKNIYLYILSNALAAFVTLEIIVFVGFGIDAIMPTSFDNIASRKTVGVIISFAIFFIGIIWSLATEIALHREVRFMYGVTSAGFFMFILYIAALQGIGLKPITILSLAAVIAYPFLRQAISDNRKRK
jgi:hypothetical protein